MAYELGGPPTGAWLVATPLAPAAPVQAPKPRGHRTLWIVLSCLVIALCLTAVGGVLAVTAHYADRAKPGVTIAGTPVQGQDAQQLAHTVASIVASIKIPLSYGDRTWTATLSDLATSVDQAGVVRAALDATAGSSPFTAYNPNTTKAVPLPLTTDEAALQETLNQRFITQAETRTDASVTYDAAAKTWSVVPGRAGQVVDPSAVDVALRQAAADPASVAPVALGVGMDEPRIPDTAAQQAADTANAAMGLTIQIANSAKDPANKKTYVVTPDDIAQWTILTPSDETGTITVSYDKAKIAATLPGELAPALYIPPVNKQVLTADGTPIVTQFPGLPGDKVGDTTAVVEAVYDALTQGADASLTVAMDPVDFETEEIPVPTNYGDPNGAKWVDIDLLAHTVTAYEGTTQVFGPVLITSGSEQHPSDVGTFYVYIKYDKQTMEGGSKADGSYYKTENVPWVSYYYGSQAMHGAPWRATFGGYGSHGCINMKVSDAKWIYDWAPLGTKVVVHNGGTAG